MKAFKKIVKGFFISILSLAVGFSVFYVAFPTQANDVINWTVELFEKEEQSTEQPPVQEQPSEQDPEPEQPTPDEPEEPTDPEPEQPTPDEPEEPTDPDPQMVSVDVYMCDTNVGVIEIEQDILDDRSAFESFWLENYDTTIKSQIGEDYILSSFEIFSNDQESAIWLEYLKQKKIEYEDIVFTYSPSTIMYDLSENEKILSGSLTGGVCFMYDSHINDYFDDSKIITNFNEGEYEYHFQIDAFATMEGTVYVLFRTSEYGNGTTGVTMIFSFTENIKQVVIYSFNMTVCYNGTVEL